MRKAIILLLLLSFCGGSAETSSPQPQQEEQQQSQENTSQNNSQETNQSQSSEQSNAGNEPQTQVLTVQTLPDIKEFMKNKSDRFFVDFEDIIAGHPYVGKRSPRPHNDAQVYFSNTDPRWREATLNVLSILFSRSSNGCCA